MLTGLPRIVRRATRAVVFLFAGASLLLASDAWSASPRFSQVQFRPHEGARAGNGARRAEMREQRREQRLQEGGGQRAQRAAQREQAQQQRGQQAREAQPPPPKPPEQPAANEGRPGRLTPDERRALRQQINDAGREIYRPRRP